MMKKLLLLIPFSIFGTLNANAQCTPVDCSASLPVYGGICDSMLNDGDINQAYNDFESFVMNGECFDAGVFDPNQAGTDIQIVTVHDITFGSMPAGITGATNQATYTTNTSTNTLGCASFTGTPTEAGVFNCTIDLLVDVNICGFIPIPLSNQNAQYVMWMTIKPDPTFTGLNSTYCSTDGAVTLTSTGTAGGTFSGPGVTGNSFDPATAGAGTHTIMYLVSAQQGAAIAPATDSMQIVVTVTSAGGTTTIYADTDLDGFGDPASSSTTTGCTIPTGYSLTGDDCDDTNPAIYPGATDIPGNGIDENCDGVDGYLAIGENELSSLRIYPNPTENTLSIDGLEGETESITISNASGKIMYSFSKINTTSYDINVQSLESGIYFVKVNATKVIRFIKK